MVTTVFFVRHGTHGQLGRILCGRMPDVALAEQGRLEAKRVGAYLALSRVNAVYASPIQRTQETASIIAQTLDLAAQPADALTEVDVGGWTGQSFDALRDDPAWQRWNEARSQHRPPGGEGMLEAQLRVVSWLSHVIARHAGQAIVAVSHADIIKAALAHAIGLSLDHHHRLEVGPGSISVVVGGEWGMKMHSMNEAPR